MSAIAAAHAGRPVASHAQPASLRDLDVAYVVQLYPKVSHVFIQREVLGLRAAGARVTTYTLHRPPADEIRSDADRRESVATVALRPASAARLARVHARALVTRPRAYFDTLSLALRSAPRGLKALVWQVLYFGQAVVLHDELCSGSARHLHAHLANVATDVTWLAAQLGNRAGTGPWTWSFTMHGPTEFRDVDAFNLGRKVAAANLVVCISDFCRSQLMALSAPEHWAKLVIVHCGVDLERYELIDRDQRVPRRLLSVGRLVPEKGQSLFLELVAELRARGHDVDAVLVGDGPDRDALRARRDELGLTDVVLMPGALGQDELVAEFERADVFVMPSFEEGVPVVLMEAMASGLPVVATRIAGIPELIEHGVGGLLVAPGRADALLDATEHVLSDAGARRQFADAGRAEVSERFDAAREARRLGAHLLAVQTHG